MNTAEQDARFEDWMRDHAAILYKVANAFAQGADRSDLMQELMLAVWKAVPAFRGEAKPSTFIYRVSHNAAMGWKRGQRGYRRRLEQLAAWSAVEPPSGPTAVERAALDRVYAAIRELSDVDRSLILLSLDEVSYQDMAQIHGLSESNVGVRLNRIRARLAQKLQEPG
jgi:RNA polymerase sigma factor (sigma-70 family)